MCLCSSKVLLTTPTTPTGRMKAIVEAAEGFVYLVSCGGLQTYSDEKEKRFFYTFYPLGRVLIALNYR